MADTIVDVTANTTTLSNQFKIKYGKKSYAVFNTSTPTWSRIRKEHGGLKGKSLSLEAVLGFTGSVGSGGLPLTNVFNDQNASLTRKKLYARILLDREAMIASQGNENAFEAVSKRQVKKGVESFMRNIERMLFAYENGKLAEGDGSTNVTGAGTSGSPYVVTCLSSTWVDGFIELNDYVNIATETTPLKVVAVNRSTKAISLDGTSATLAAAAGGPSATSAKIYMQGSKDNDMQSILAACKQTSSTLYGITIGEKWQSQQINASSAGVTTDLINQLVTQVEVASGESPDIIVTSPKQKRKIADILGDKLRYMDVTNRDKMFRKTEFNFQGLQWNTESGVIPVVTSRMCPDDHLFALNTDNIVLYTAEAPKWFDEDGTVLLRSSSADAYEARYGLYGELFVHPQAQGVLYGLA